MVCFSYGYVTNTKIKFIIIVDSSDTTLRDNEIRSVSLHFTMFSFNYFFYCRCLGSYILNMLM